MDERILPFISKYQPCLEELLSCSKQFTSRRTYNLRWKNRVYFRDGAIKVMDCKDPEDFWVKCKEVWYKEGKLHRDERDPETGLTLPARIYANGTKVWYKDGKKHCVDRDPETGLTLPAEIYVDGELYWYREGLRIDPPCQ